MRRPRRRWAGGVVLVGATLLGCAPEQGRSPRLPGSGGGPLGSPPADTASATLAWRGYDAAVVVDAGTTVCDRVWDTVGVGSDLPCVDCALVVEIEATLRADAGAGGACPSETYWNTYAWRPATADASLPTGLLAHQPGGWVWIGEASMADGPLVGRGSFTSGERSTHFVIVGEVLRP